MHLQDLRKENPCHDDHTAHALQAEQLICTGYTDAVTPLPRARSCSVQPPSKNAVPSSHEEACMHPQRPTQKRRSHSSMHAPSRSCVVEASIPAVTHAATGPMPLHSSNVCTSDSLHSPQVSSKRPHLTVHRVRQVQHSQVAHESSSVKIGAAQQLLQQQLSLKLDQQLPPLGVPKAPHTLATPPDLIQPAAKHQRSLLNPLEIDQQPIWQVSQPSSILRFGSWIANYRSGSTRVPLVCHNIIHNCTKTALPRACRYLQMLCMSRLFITTSNLSGTLLSLQHLCLHNTYIPAKLQPRVRCI